MHFSLIVATINRTKEIKRFLQSLASQSYKNFELIVVDQNSDDRLVPILEPYKTHFPILHIRSAPGLSRARNIGLRYVKGDIVAFPDDDCWYPPDLLEKVANFFQKHPDIDGLAGRSIDENGKPSVGRWDEKEGLIDMFNVWRRAISFSIFLKTKVINEVGDFDETLGVGAGTPWGAGEETDYIVRTLKLGFKIYYYPSINIYHPQKTPVYDVRAISRAYSYGMGFGRVLRKHKYPLWFLGYYLIRPLSGIILSLLTGNFSKAKYYGTVLNGRFLGYLSKDKNHV